MTRVVLYSKPGCHLCDDVKAAIEHVRQSRPFDFEIRNIEHDARHFTAYQHAIPVVTLNDTEIARYRMTEADLLAALDAQTG